MASSPPRGPEGQTTVRAPALSSRAETYLRLNDASDAEQVRRIAEDFEKELGEDVASEHARSELAAVVAGTLARIELEKRLDLAIKSREALMASVAHDLRNPLNTFAMSSGLLRDDLERNDVDVTRGLGLSTRMERATTRMQSLIEDLLEASRVDARLVELGVKPESAAQLARDAVTAAGPVAAERRAHIVTDTLDETAVVDVDRARWLQALSKAIAYAAKTTGDNGVIRLGVGREGPNVVFTLQATIPGSAVPSSEDASRGGLSVLLARGIVELHGGSFRIDMQQELTMSVVMPATA